MSERTGNHGLPRPVIKKMRWPFPWIWIVPILAAALAGYYFYGRAVERGEKIIVLFDDASGLKQGETPVEYRGVQVGQVSKMYLSDDRSQVKVEIRLQGPVEDIAKEGAKFWIERPDFSGGNISGLSTVFSGPFVQVIPGDGPPAMQFTGLNSAPVTTEKNGLRIVLHTAQAPHLQVDSPVYFRGIPVGEVEKIKLGPDSTQVDIQVVIHERYGTLVRTNSQFWSVSGADLKGGIFTGISFKLESLRSLISGGVAFASPDKDMGPAANFGAEFDLHDEAKKDWQAWSPRIELPADNPDKPQGKMEKPKSPVESMMGK
jgi:paraquat-inducible protein B